MKVNAVDWCMKFHVGETWQTFLELRLTTRFRLSNGFFALRPSNVDCAYVRVHVQYMCIVVQQGLAVVIDVVTSSNDIFLHHLIMACHGHGPWA